jgi:hypothetical protein
MTPETTNLLDRLHLVVNPAIRTNIAVRPGEDFLYLPVRLAPTPGSTAWAIEGSSATGTLTLYSARANFVRVEANVGGRYRQIEVSVANLAIDERAMSDRESALFNEHLWTLDPGHESASYPNPDDPDEEPEEEEPEENERDYNGERITLEEECAACGTELHHSRGEFGNDGDDIEVPYWRFVYDPVCEEMQVDSGSMVCRECLENGSDFEHSVDCFSDDEDAPEDFDQIRESQRAYMEAR